MATKNHNDEKSLYSLISLEDFKSVMGIDDREDRQARFCLVTATLTIEQHCKRKLLCNKYFETIEFSGDLFIPLREYPVSEVLAFYLFGNGEMLEPEFYSVIPDCGNDYDLPYSLSLSPALQRYRRLSAVKVVYWAGYVENPHPCGFSTRSFCGAKTPTKAIKTAASMPLVPADLAAACMELASWNINRYRGRRVGMTGNIRGAGREGEHFELSMPENVKALLEPYRRKVI
jgi:hypothetical protein